MSTEDIGMQTGGYLYRRKTLMQNPMPHNRIFGVTDSDSQSLCVSNTDSQNLRSSLSGVQTLRVSFSDVQKEKDSTANATLWDDGSFHHKINQSVNRKANVLYFKLQTIKNYNSLRDVVRFPDNIGLVSYCSTNSPSLRGRVNQMKGIYSVNKHTVSLTLWTEKGTDRISKIVDTDEGQGFFEKIEFAYFHHNNNDEQS
ncbi:hypothetical protein [Xenorhabdus lircayensis]|uniref:hypothetical protein n=1 Tax=Xenorhabdus lircayensis TaxID=2763499 RepID=UPI001E48ECEA|nr:hypothetical protein [Xenorhabdus lircayensis]